MFVRLAVVALSGCALCAPAQLYNGINAVVHDAVVTYQQVELLTEQTRDVIERSDETPEAYRRRQSEVRGENLTNLMNRELILHEFTTAGYRLPESVIDDLVQEQIRVQFGDRRTLTKTLQAQGMTYEKFRQQRRDRFIIEQLRQQNVKREIIISPTKIQQYYDQRTNSFKIEEEVKLRMIILTRAPGDQGGDMLKLAEDIRTKIQEGATFSEMAAIHSQGPERSKGGERPWQEARELRKELAEAVAGLKVGEVSRVVDTGDAVWLVQVEDKRPARVRPLSEVREQIEKDLLVAEQKRIEQQWLDRLRKKTYQKFY